MLVAKKRLPVSPLTVAADEPVLPAAKKQTRRVILAQNRFLPKKETKPDPDPLPFDKWNIPKQEEGYLKGRENDFL
ncbi:MAG: hypothetical protein JNK14_04915 [Chitinophagaceae bacterium]|nr:hypothetical protein [Chitinophagaceae bacterium]